MLRFKARQTIKPKNTIPTPDTGRCVATEHTACSSGHFSLVTFSLGQQRESDPARGSEAERPLRKRPGRNTPTRRVVNQPPSLLIEARESPATMPNQTMSRVTFDTAAFRRPSLACKMG
ncbi:hypothetical protein SAMN05216570_1976 [Dyella sp. OK004]|nr:hypothetical protein SAMN05216570_1976 [Dyella sp. OK004]